MSKNIPTLFFEDFLPGSSQSYGSVTVDREAMVAYAREFDAQPMHIDDEAAKATMAGELIASGWFTASLNMRMIADDFILRSSGLGSPGVSDLKWLKPVKAGDRLHGVRHVLQRRASATKPDRGFVNFRFDVFNQNNEKVMEQTNLIMFSRRDRTPLTHAAGSIQPVVAMDLPVFHDIQRDTIPFFEDVVVGERLDIGTKLFSAEDIIRFAKDFDPQPFHLSVEAGKASHFGGLSASGWHTGSVWMGQMVRSRTEAAMNAMRRGARPARLGPSGGFEHLRWHRPVLAGDTIRYTSAVRAKRVSASKPEWGIVNHYNTGINQRGEEVFSFQGMVFWERRPA